MPAWINEGETVAVGIPAAFRAASIKSGADVKLSPQTAIVRGMSAGEAGALVCVLHVNDAAEWLCVEKAESGHAHAGEEARFSARTDNMLMPSIAIPNDRFLINCISIRQE